MFFPIRAVSLGLMATEIVAGRRPTAPKLHLEEFGADSTAWHVTSTLIVGPTEVLLWDAQYHLADARRLADRVAATGKRLTAIVLSHPDHDHYLGAAAIVERFPGTPVYMTAAALDEYRKTAPREFAQEKARNKDQVPDSIVTPTELPSNRLTVDGEVVEVIPDLTGDVRRPTNSALWIPSLETVLAGDIAFNGVHPWLGSSDPASRAAWKQSLEKLAALHPKAVVAGHKRDLRGPDSPAVLDFMRRYLTDFEAGKKASTTPDALIALLKGKYPDLADLVLAIFSSRIAFRPEAGGE